MVSTPRWMHALAAALVSAGCLQGCGESQLDDRVFGRTSDESPVVEADAGAFPDLTPTPRESDEVECEPAVASDRLPARSNLLQRAQANAANAVQTDDLFEQFKAHCVGCHVDTNLGGFQVRRSDFASQAKRAQLEKALARVRSDDPAQIMPPPPVGVPFSQRPESDPVRIFAKLFEAWLKAGAPNDAFYPEGQAAAAGSSDKYVLSRDVAEQMTNLGNCVPTSARGFAAEHDKSAQLDAMFEAATALPERLDQTDLISWDSKELARYGVVAFAPAYTLWADNAKKVRMVRVPRGESIKFDRDTQSFTIPPNTRFYKTFMKHVIDKSGKSAYRKMETRLIVSRPDDPSKDGPERTRALFGTYAWNEDETEAVLVRDPLRNGKPFRDRLITYATDEQRAEQLVNRGAKDIPSTLRKEGLSRTYAIPGSERCIHCHMGAADSSFVLGFTPLQLNRRPKGEGGVIEPAERDELNQVERLIRYGVITGMMDATEVTPLEESQGTRTPRNEHELDAQGYMLGNCAHCHNPRGFPSWVATELKDLLDLSPSADGGIFRFPLNRFSPRIFRGANQDTPIPYITPSLVDMPSGYDISYDRDGLPLVYPKLLQCQGGEYDSGFGKSGLLPVLAPWRSLIYRNVENAFNYADDYAIFPHMPRDTPGYDCRAKQLLGTWMASIPARYREPADPLARQQELLWTNMSNVVVGTTYREGRSDEPQPYQEVENPTTIESILLDSEAKQRVALFKAEAERCPPDTQDIVDPEIVQGQRNVPIVQPPELTPLDAVDACDAVAWVSTPNGPTERFGIGPQRPHYFVSDLTEPATTWSPRRSDWRGVLVDGAIPFLTASPILERQERAQQDRTTVYLLTGLDPWRNVPSTDWELAQADGPYPQRSTDLRITQALRDFALTPFPLGLWQEKPQCSLSEQPLVSSYQGDQRPFWMDWGGWKQSASASFGEADPAAHVYSITPGAQLFNSICANCHGPLGDSRGRMADTIADMTGGDTRVANLRDGLLGPNDPATAGSNRAGVFQVSGGPSLGGPAASLDDWASRYLLWMGLGGTQRNIPRAVLTVVASTRVLGIQRKGLDGMKDAGANMLTLPEYICSQSLFGGTRPNFDVKRGRFAREAMYPKATEDEHVLLPVFSVNGDAELWERLCTLDNPAPVRAIDMVVDKDGGPLLRASAQSLYHRDSYGDSLVGDARGHVVQGLKPDNAMPWCLRRQADAAREQKVTELYRAARPGDNGPLPWCPDFAGTARFNAVAAGAPVKNRTDGELWARRGAMNAGLSVFVYLDALAKGKVQRPVDYNHCEELP